MYRSNIHITANVTCSRYFLIQKSFDKPEAILVVEQGVHFVWMALADGGWILTPASITIKEFHRSGSGGIAEMHIGSRVPFPVNFEIDGVFHQYLCMFDQQRVIKEMMIHKHANKLLGEKALRDEYVRLMDIEEGELYKNRNAPQ